VSGQEKSSTKIRENDNTPVSGRKIATTVTRTIWQVAKGNNHKCGTTR